MYVMGLAIDIEPKDLLTIQVSIGNGSPTTGATSASVTFKPDP